MYAYASVLFALYSLGDILVCFLKYRPKKELVGKTVFVGNLFQY